ncbi:MAG: UDP-GlcNAc:undecaprenyl-phosphate/decaprenyl-phosphate GlcNAc-phosphate transferase [Acidimicrobiaceae bacterium]
MVAAGALITAVLVMPVAMWIGRQAGLVDRPGPLKVHAHPVPYLGGLGVAAALAWGVAATRPSLLIPLGAALALGVVDDATGLTPVLRMVGELAIGTAVGVCLPAGDHRALAVVFAALVTVVLCNAVNMIDGLDGLAGGTAAVAAIGFYVVLSGDGATIAIALTAGLAAFLAFNRPPARVYLGDGGAYLVGTALATLFLLACESGSGASFGVAALLVGYPLVELVFTVIRRSAQRKSPLSGDRQHVYDQLHARGASASVAALLCVAFQAALVAVAIIVAPRSAAVGLVTAGACGMMILAAGILTGLLAPRTRRS